MQRLKDYAANYGLYLNDIHLESFAIYRDQLLKWNERVNLTAITELNEIIIKHFLDSILILCYCDIPLNSTLVDIGAGAGFPSIPLKIVRSDLKVTQVDSLQKRTLFLSEISKILGMDNIVIHARAEELARNLDYRETFAYVTARAVAPLRVLCEYCIPFVSIGGTFIAMKGADVEKEKQEAQHAFAVLGQLKTYAKEYQLPNGDKRSVVTIEKRSQTPTEYPRTQKKISKAPL